MDAEIDRVILKALEPDMKERFSTAKEFYDAIEQYELQKIKVPSENIQKALKLGKQYTKLNDAIKLLEESINQHPKDCQKLLKEKYSETLKNWKKGVIM